MARIYILKNRTSEDVYVGSTTEKLNYRFNHHISHYREFIRGTSKKARCSSFNIVQCPTAYIELLEECNEDVRYDRERYWIENTPHCINPIRRPRRSNEEKKAYHQEWAERNRETLRQYQREYMRRRRQQIREQSSS